MSYKRKVEFVSLERTCKTVQNPCRGWYEIYSFAIEEDIDYEQLVWCLREDETLALVIIDISAFKDEPLSDTAICNLENCLTFFGRSNKNVILRITYDRAGCAKQSEPYSFSTVLMHMTQLGEVIEKYSKIIFLCQGLFVGNWGEMHGSAYLSYERIKKMYETLYLSTHGKVIISVRKPVQWRYIVDLENKKNNKNILGLFDDGMFGSRTNLGTFGNIKKSKKKWNESWDISDELKFQDDLCMTVPYGGEAVWSEYADNLTAGFFVERLRKSHVTYLNCAHDKRILDKWKNITYEGMSLYDYITVHMGYSLKIDKIKYNKTGKKIKVSVSVRNNGFAPLYEKSIIILCLVTYAGKCFPCRVNNDYPLLCCRTYNFKFEIPFENGEIYIRMQRQSDEAKIAFTNLFDSISDEYGCCVGRITSQHKECL